MHEWKQHKPWFDEECLGFLNQRKRAKMQWVQDPCQSNVDNLNSVRREVSRHFRNKKKERKLRAFENMVLRSIFGPRRDEVTGEWRRLHNEELSDLYSSPNIVRLIKSRRMRWAGHVARMGEERGAYSVLVGKPEGKRPLGRPRRRWVDNIRMDLQKVGCGYVDWIGLAQDRDRWQTLVSTVMNFRVP